MTQLTKNFRKYKVIFKDKREPLNITEDQYNQLRLAKEDKKYNDPITIKDIDTQKILFDWEIWKIEEFQERNNINWWYTMICWFWDKHPLINWKFECDWKTKYNFTEIELKTFAIEKYWIIYPQDITIEMKRELYNITKQKWK